MNHNIYLYIAAMAFATYLVRMLPLTLLHKEIKNVYLRSFLHYVPYVTLAAMTFPAIITATGNWIAGVLAIIFASVIAYTTGNLFKVSMGACAIVFITEYVMNFL